MILIQDLADIARSRCSSEALFQAVRAPVPDSSESLDARERRAASWPAREFPIHFFPHMIGKIGLLNFCFQRADFVFLSIALAEFLLNRLQLFAQEILALGLAQLLLWLRSQSCPVNWRICTSRDSAA